ncbi:MAG: hypothetical protein AAFR61_14865 [Bacteroidota bacterium]
MRLNFYGILLLFWGLWSVSYAQDLLPCYVIGDDSRPDLLVKVDPVSGQSEAVGTGLGVSQVEASCLDVTATFLWATNGCRLGKVDLQNGKFKALPIAMGVARAGETEIDINNVNGLALDPLKGRLLAVHQRKDKADVLVQLNQESGRVVPHAFGPHQDFLEIEMPGGKMVIDDLAFHPGTGVLYAVANAPYPSRPEKLVKINLVNGQISYQATLYTRDDQTAQSFQLRDMEGMSFDERGQLYVSGGSQALPKANALWKVNLADGRATFITIPEASSDYEACACGGGKARSVRVSSFLDRNGDGRPGIGEPRMDFPVQLFVRQADGRRTPIKQLTADPSGWIPWVGGLSDSLFFQLMTDGRFAAAEKKFWVLPPNQDTLMIPIYHGAFLPEWGQLNEGYQRYQQMTSNRGEKRLFTFDQYQISIPESLAQPDLLYLRVNDGNQAGAYQLSLPNAIGAPTTDRLLRWLSALPIEEVFQDRIQPSFTVWQLFTARFMAQGVLAPRSGNLSSR